MEVLAAVLTGVGVLGAFGALMLSHLRAMEAHTRAVEAAWRGGLSLSRLAGDGVEDKEKG